MCKYRHLVQTLSSHGCRGRSASNPRTRWARRSGQTGRSLAPWSASPIHQQALALVRPCPKWQGGRVKEDTRYTFLSSTCMLHTCLSICIYMCTYAWSHTWKIKEQSCVTLISTWLRIMNTHRSLPSNVSEDGHGLLSSFSLWLQITSFRTRHE